MAGMSIADRMKLTRRRQASLLGGPDADAASEPVKSTVVPAAEISKPGALSATMSAHVAMAMGERGLLLADLECLLRAVGTVNQYTSDEIDLVMRSCAAQTPQGRVELEAFVRMYRMECVVHDYRAHLEAEVWLRAWVQFRREVMGCTVDENGVPYDALQPEDTMTGALEEGIKSMDASATRAVDAHLAPRARSTAAEPAHV